MPDENNGDEGAAEPGPNKLAREAQELLDELLPLREAATDKRERKLLSQRIKLARTMRNWARTRAGYVEQKKAPAKRT